MTATIIRTPTDYVAIGDFYRPIARDTSRFLLERYVRSMGYHIVTSWSRQGEAILERSGFQKLKRTK